MFYRYDEPKTFCVVFKDGRRPPLFIRKVKALKTGKMITFLYLNKWDKPHQHRYYKGNIIYHEVTLEQMSNYRHEVKLLKQKQQEKENELCK